MRALWNYAGNDPPFEKSQLNQITAQFFPITDPKTDLQRRLLNSKARNYAVGLYMASNWPEFDGLDGPSIAEKTWILYSALGVKAKVQFDIEQHDPELVANCLERWRAYAPNVDTSWTMESMQGGWMTASSEFVRRILACKVRLVPQCYKSPGMTPVCPRAACNELEDIGFPRTIVSPFYDATRLPLYWDGFALGTLP